jgi:hypothetical protein
MRLWKKIAQSVSRTIFFVKINAQPKPRKKVAQKCEAVYANFQKKKNSQSKRSHRWRKFSKSDHPGSILIVRFSCSKKRKKRSVHNG